MQLSIHFFLCFLLSAGALRRVSAIQLYNESEWPWSNWGKKKPKTVEDVKNADIAKNADSDVVHGRPSQPGCYMHMPSGCPKRPMKTRAWRHDTWAEERKLNMTGCMDRKRAWDKWCEVEDSKMVYIDKDGTSSSSSVDEDATSIDPDVIEGYPSQPGCYMRMPTKCPKQPMKTSMWRRDTTAEQQGLDEARCKDRKDMWDKYCGAEDTKMLYVTKEISSKPESELKSTEMASTSSSPSIDSNARLADPNIIEGYPSQPGCYMRMPTKCPKQPMKTSMWRRDTSAEQHGLDEARCKGRKDMWDTYCGAEDTKMLYVTKE